MERPCQMWGDNEQDKHISNRGRIPEIFEIGRKDLFPPFLPLLIAYFQNMTKECSVSLCIRQFVTVHIPNCSNDCFCESVLV